MTLIADKTVRNFPVHHVALVKGDSLSYSIAAASFIPEKGFADAAALNRWLDDQKDLLDYVMALDSQP